MHKFEVSENLQEILKKLSGKDKSLYEQILKKMNEVINSLNIEHQKNHEVFGIQKTKT